MGSNPSLSAIVVMIKIKRVYEKPSKDDGFRILIDRLWPRGVSKEKANVDLWAKDLAPSDGLRKWFQHDPKKWSEFKKRYFAELKGKDLDFLRKKKGTVTIVYGAKEERYNNAVALVEFLKKA